MMKSIGLMALLGISLIANSFIAAHAYPWGKGVNVRQKHERHRIAQGINSGQVTGCETKRLKKQAKNIAKKEALFRATGKGLNKAELAKLDRMQDRFSHNIYRQKHDNDMR